MEAVAANRDTSIRHSGSPFDPAVPMAEGKGQFCLYRLHCLQSRHHRESLARIPEGREQLLWIHFGACVRHDDHLCPDVRFLCGAWIAWPRQNHCCHVGWAIGFSLSLFFLPGRLHQRDNVFHAICDVPAEMQCGRCVSRSAAIDRWKHRSVCSFLSVRFRLAFGDDHDWGNRQLPDVLYSRVAVRRYGDLAAGLRLSPRLWTLFSSPVRVRLRPVGEFHAAGVFACFIGIACTATIDILTG